MAANSRKSGDTADRLMIVCIADLRANESCYGHVSIPTLNPQSVAPTPHFAIAFSFSRIAFEMNLK